MAIWFKKLGNKKLYKLFAPQVHLIDIRNLFKDKSLEGAMRELGETARIYEGEPDLEKEGIYLDDSDNTGEDNTVVGVLKEYFNNNFNNPNLLINSYFKNPVNQRGKKEYILDSTERYKYTIDRWNAFDGGNGTNYSVKLTERGLLIHADKNTDYLRFRQAIPLLSEYLNRNMTVSYKCTVSEGNPYIQIFSADIINNYASADSIDKNVQYMSENKSLTTKIESNNKKYLVVDIAIPTSDTPTTVLIEWVKLELGSKATPFYPRHYTEEEMLCKRYFNIIYNGMSEGEYNNALVPQTYRSNTITVFERFPVKMRTIPTITYNDIKVVSNSNVLTGFSFTTQATDNSISITATKTNHGLTSGTCNITTSKLCLDAEIY